MAEVIDLNDHRSDAGEPRFYNSDHYAEVRQFNPKIALCSICSSARHRAGQCPLRPRSAPRNTD